MNNFEEKIYGGFSDELRLIYCGKRLKNLSHNYGPHTLNTYLLYYIMEGTATLYYNGKSEEITGPGFLVHYPKCANSYQCKRGVPWGIKWIVADGAMIEKYLSIVGISREKPYIKLEDGRGIDLLFDKMYESFDKGSTAAAFSCISLLYELFSLLAEKAAPKSEESMLIKKAYSIINCNFSNPDFNVSMLAEMLGLHFNYFSVLFKQETGISPIKAICECRFLNADKMLRFTDKSIKEVAVSCGFADEFYFSRSFKKRFGKSPREYRKIAGYEI